jgi:hypothetical protein
VEGKLLEIVEGLGTWKDGAVVLERERERVRGVGVEERKRERKRKRRERESAHGLPGGPFLSSWEVTPKLRIGT